MSGFGKYKEGYISLQDHPGVISYKNIKIEDCKSKKKKT